MTWADRYTLPTMALWQGRPDIPRGSCFFQNIQLVDIQQDVKVHDQPALAILGFCCDEGIRRNHGRLGAAEGPSAIREALSRMPMQRKDIVCYDAGDITCNDNDLESAQAALGEAVYTLIKHNITPLVIGGGHELAWGHFQGIAKKYPSENLGIINFDAHFDMRPLLENDKGSSGTPFLQIAEAHQQAHRRFDYNCIGIQNTGNIQQLFATAKKYETQFIFADDIHEGDMNKYFSLVNHVIYYNQFIYLSLCLDVFSSPFAPGVSAPQPFGLTPWQIVPALRKLAESGKVIGYDIAEMSPKYDLDSRTARLAASMIYEIVHHHKL